MWEMNTTQRTELTVRVEMLTLAMVDVNEAAKHGSAISAWRTARRVLRRFPNSPMPIEELQTEIARLAVENGVPVEFG